MAEITTISNDLWDSLVTDNRKIVTIKEAKKILNRRRIPSKDFHKYYRIREDE